MSYNQSQGFPADPYNPQWQPINVQYGQPPFVPGVPYPQSMANTDVIPKIVSAAILEIQNNMGKNNFRMLMYNLASQNGWNNKVFNDVVLYLSHYVDMVFQQQQPGHANVDQIISNVVPDMVAMFTSDLVRLYPQMQQFLTQDNAGQVQAASQNLCNLIDQIQNRMNQQWQIQQSNQFANQGGYQGGYGQPVGGGTVYRSGPPLAQGGAPGGGNYFGGQQRQPQQQGYQMQHLRPNTAVQGNYFNNGANTVQNLQRPNTVQQPSGDNRSQLRIARLRRQKEVQAAGLIYDPSLHAIEVLEVFDPREWLLSPNGELVHRPIDRQAEQANAQPVNYQQQQPRVQKERTHHVTAADILKQPFQPAQRLFPPPSTVPYGKPPITADVELSSSPSGPQVLHRPSNVGIPPHYEEKNVDVAEDLPFAGQVRYSANVGAAVVDVAPVSESGITVNTEILEKTSLPNWTAVQSSRSALAEPDATVEDWTPNPDQYYLPAYRPNKMEVQYFHAQNGVVAQLRELSQEEKTNMDYTRHVIGIVPKKHLVAGAEGEVPTTQPIVNHEVKLKNFDVESNPSWKRDYSEDKIFNEFELTMRLARPDDESADKVHRGNALVALPIVCTSTAQAARVYELLNEIRAARTFANAAALLKTIDEAELLQVRTLVNDLLTVEVNKALNVNLSLSAWIDSFETDAAELENYLRGRFGDEISMALKQNESALISRTITVMDKDEAAAYTQDDILDGEGLGNDEELRQRVVYITHYASINLLNRNAWELNLALDPNFPAVVLEGEHAEVYSLIKSIYADDINDASVCKNLYIQTLDGVRISVTRGFLNRESYLIKRVPRVA